VDIAWNRDDSMIASVGLDSTIFIWDGYTFGEYYQPYQFAIKAV